MNLDRYNALIEEARVLEMRNKEREATTRYQVAYDLCSQAIEADPNDAEAYLKRAQLTSYNLSYPLEETVADFAQAVRLQPDRMDWWQDYASYLHVHYGCGCEYERSLTVFNKLIEIDPTNPGGYSMRADALSSGHVDHTLEDYQQAIVDMSEYIRLLPASPVSQYMSKTEGLMWAYIRRAKMYVDDPAAEEAHYNRTVEAAPNSSSGYEHRGDFYYDSGQEEKALADYTRVVELRPKKPINDGYYKERRHRRDKLRRKLQR